jgi:hypothetical protein
MQRTATFVSVHSSATPSSTSTVAAVLLTVIIAALPGVYTAANVLVVTAVDSIIIVIISKYSESASQTRAYTVYLLVARLVAVVVPMLLLFVQCTVSLDRHM